MTDAENILRRESDKLFAHQLTKCEVGIEGLSRSLAELRESVHTQVGSLSLQIAKLPAPMTLEDMERRFITRAESEKEDQLINKLMDTYITKEEIRPLKVALYGLWATIGAGLVSALITYVMK